MVTWITVLTLFGLRILERLSAWNKAVDDTSPVRKKEFDEAISGGDSGLKDQVDDNTARLDKEIDYRKKGDEFLVCEG